MNVGLLRRMPVLMVLALLVYLLFPFAAYASTVSAEMQVGDEQQSPVTPTVITLMSQDGNHSLTISNVNADPLSLEHVSDYLALFTSGAKAGNLSEEDTVPIPEQHVALVVDGSGQVINIIGPEADPPTVWAAPTAERIPEGGYIVIAGNGAWDSSPNMRPLYLHFKLGDSVRLMKDGVEMHAGDLVSSSPEPAPQPGPNPNPEPDPLPDPNPSPDPNLNPQPDPQPTPNPEPEPKPNPEPQPELKPELHVVTPTDTVSTVVYAPMIEVSGYVTNYSEEMGLKLMINEHEAAINATGGFQLTMELTPGPNSMLMRLLKGDNEVGLVSLLVTYDNSQAAGDYIEVEAAPADISIGVEGPRKKIDYIDRDVTGISNVIALFTRDYGPSITIPQFNVAVQVDGNNRVMRVVNPSINGSPPVWTGPTQLDIPEGGYVLMGQDNSYTANEIKRYLAVHFKSGDVIKLRKNGEVVPVQDLMSGQGWIPKLTLTNAPMVTVTDSQYIISGTVTNIDHPDAVSLMMNDTAVPVGSDGSFTYAYPLVNGTNYIDVKVMKNGIQQDIRHLVVFSRPGFSSQKEVLLWVDQASNAKKFQTSGQVYAFLKKAKDNGVTGILFDVKGVEGYASYKKNDLTGRPYISEIKTPERAGSNPDLDLLQEFVTHGHALGLKVHAAINVFAEGSIAYQEFAVLNDHLDWEERVYFPENNGEIKRLRESAKQGLVAFVNPANDEVRNYQLRTFEEIIKNYEVDGIVHDRSRYDNESADFSDETRVKFEQFLQARGKQLVNWPQDIFQYENNVRVDGPLIQDWWEFRSATIKSFFGEVKSMVDAYEVSTGRSIQVSSYVGSWYETYYLNGVNWGSTNFRFDPRLGLNEESVYTSDYYQTAYIEYLDFLMIGAYQTTSQEVKKYITLGNIVTNGEIPMYAGIALTNVQSPAVQREVFQAGLKNTNGLMLFDASQINWPIASAALRDEEYIKDYQLGMSLPGHNDSYLPGNFYNINLIEGNINVMTEAFGTSTGTSKYGVEVVVDASGQVTRVANKNQAINWNWVTQETNNSVIPSGGFVISTLDPSGTRTNRQLVANAYSIGDQVRASVLSGMLDDEGRKTADSQVTIEGLIEVLGPGKAVVMLNGKPAVLKESGEFTAVIPLSAGSNTVIVEVWVDDLKTNSKTLEIVKTSADGGGGTPGGGDGGSGTPTVPVTPVKPVTPDRIKVTETTSEAGQAVTHAEVNLEVMLSDIEQLAKQASSSPVLAYKLSQVKDAMVVDVPVSGLVKALEQLPQGKIVLESSLGQLELPLRSFITALKERPDAEYVRISVGRLTKEQEDKVKKGLTRDHAEPLTSPLSITFAMRQGEKLLKLNGMGESRVTFTLNVSKESPAAKTTALRYDLAADRLSFVPARVNTKQGATLIELKLTDEGIYVVARYDKKFSDLGNHWAKEAIELLASKRVVEGVSDTDFAPNAPLTRAQFAAMLVRALGLKEEAYAGGFTDVKSSDWYASSVATAAKHGLIKGNEQGGFDPHANITREQISLLLLRALELAGSKVSAAHPEEALSGFKDRDAIAQWARTAVAAMAEAGLLQGRAADSFAPQATASRAEGAVVLKRMLELAGLIN